MRISSSSATFCRWCSMSSSTRVCDRSKMSVAVSRNVSGKHNIRWNMKAQPAKIKNWISSHSNQFIFCRQLGPRSNQTENLCASGGKQVQVRHLRYLENCVHFHPNHCLLRMTMTLETRPLAFLSSTLPHHPIVAAWGDPEQSFPWKIET